MREKCERCNNISTNEVFINGKLVSLCKKCYELHIKSKPKFFLVRHIEGRKNFWIDTNNGQAFEECNIPYNTAKHGLCQTLKRKVLKKVVDDGSHPLVFKAKETTTPKLTKRRITVPFRDDYGRKNSWTFEPYDIMEVIKGLEKDMSDRELCIRVCAPREAIKKLRYKLIGKLLEKIKEETKEKKEKPKKKIVKIAGGDKNGKPNKYPKTRGINYIE